MNFKTIPEMFYYNCSRYSPEKTAFLHKKEGSYKPISYKELQDNVECFALGLLNLGIKPKDRIGLVSENRIEWAIADLAISCIGAIDVPIFPTLTAKQEEFIFSDSQVEAIVVSNSFQLSKVLEFKDTIPTLRHIIVMNSEFSTNDVSVVSMKYVIERGSELKPIEKRKQIVQEYASKVEEDDLLTIIYTSGTTGNPKGVMLSHRNVVSNILGASEVVEFAEKDRFLSYLPWCHSFERTTGYYCAFAYGSEIAFAEGLESVGANIKEYRPTIMTTVPRLLEMVKKKVFAGMEKEPASKQKIFNWATEIGVQYIRAKNAGKIPLFLKTKFKIADNLVFSKIREKIGLDFIKFASGGAALPVDVCEFFLSLGYFVIEGYGLTESSPIISGTRKQNYEPGTVGIPLNGIEVKIAADGEILAKGPNIMKGYWNDPVATKEAIDEDGWLYTGDIGIFTDKGNIKITDRKKNLFVSSGGKNIAPQPIENLLAQSPFIEQVILIGDNREFLTALIAPDFEQLKKLADNFGISYENPTELISNQKIIKSIHNDIDRLQKDLSKFERVRKFSLLSMPFTVETGELTPKMSIRRHVVERKYNHLIDAMYDVK